MIIDMATKYSPKKLFLQHDVVAKYSSFDPRVRQLNLAEKSFIKHYEIYNKKVLVVGSGAGRVAANLLLFGNKVFAVESSIKLHQSALTTYPNNKFKNLVTHYGDANNLDFIKNNSFDVVFFPMNGLDYAQTLEERRNILIQMQQKLKPNGILAYSSHNLNACALSYKLKKHNPFKLFKKYEYSAEKVLGGGNIYKGSLNFTIELTLQSCKVVYSNYFCDSRNKIERFLSKNKTISKLIFPYFLLAFIKSDELLN